MSWTLYNYHRQICSIFICWNIFFQICIIFSISLPGFSFLFWFSLTTQMHNFVTALCFICIMLIEKLNQLKKHFLIASCKNTDFFNLKSMCKTAGFLPFAVLLARVLNCQFACCALITRENNGAVKNLLLLNSCLDTQPKEWTLHKFVLVVSIFVCRKHLLCNSGSKRHFYTWDIAALRCTSGNNQTCCSLNTEIAIVKIFWTHLFFCHCLFVVKFTFFIIS